MIGDRFFQSLLAGKPVQWLGKLDVPHTFSYSDDFARGLILLAEHPETYGQSWHIPAAEPMTTRDFIVLAAQIARVPAKTQEITPMMMRMLGLFMPAVRESIEMQYEFREPYLVDSSKFTGLFDFTPTPHREALQMTIAWYREHAKVTRAA